MHDHVIEVTPPPGLSRPPDNRPPSVPNPEAATAYVQAEDERERYFVAYDNLLAFGNKVFRRKEVGRV